MTFRPSDIPANRDSNWDYLLLTASNDLQARAYEGQIQLRQELGLLPRVGRALVIADTDGKRIGSGGATVRAIARVVEIERGEGSATSDEILRGLRILIVHAGGDSRRLPAYGPCGKIFLPLPEQHDGPLPLTLFDRLVPDFLNLPEGAPGRGQIVVAAGDALMDWDISELDTSHAGITMLGCLASPEEASRHGVFCLGADHSLACFLQKPSRATQEQAGAIGQSGEAVLDVGVMSMDADAAAALLGTFGSGDEAAVREWLAQGGLDMYREVCCGLGSSATLEHYIASARAGGSIWHDALLAALYPRLSGIPAHVQVLPYCRFLHFGSAAQLAPSGMALLEKDLGPLPADSSLLVNNVVAGSGSIAGSRSWVEACRINRRLELGGRNVVVGVDVDTPLSMPQEACLEVLAGRDRSGSDVWFTRVYGVRDTFKDSIARNGQFCGQPMLDWIQAAGMDPHLIWPDAPDPSQRTLWNARVFPAGASEHDFRRWLWMYEPRQATAAEKSAYQEADRYSAEQIALLTDQRAFYWRRLENWARRQSAAEPSRWAARVLAAAKTCFTG